MKKYILALLLAGVLVGCSSPSKVPDVDSGDLITPKFQGVNPRNIRIIVTDERQINRNAGNTLQVEQAVYKTVAAALTRGGLTVKQSSKNRLSLLIQDYNGPGAMGECVQIQGTVHAKWGSEIYAEAMGCHQLKHLTGISLGGDISEAYKYALNFVLQKLDDEQMQLVGY